jgi:acetoin utilization deacetylase AcuC-like enzyme
VTGVQTCALPISRKRKIPLAAVLAGGYAEDVNDTVAIHVHTVLELLGWENR